MLLLSWVNFASCFHAMLTGGGFHHCSSKSGGGFCAYADITLALKVCLCAYSEKNHDIVQCFVHIQFMFGHIDGIRRAMIVDFDAHQVGQCSRHVQCRCRLCSFNS